MAKQDQRILKFLTQNADRAPTITDMMTRLNISISDITSSLNSLMAQGMVSKRTNGQGIECWFPVNGAPQQLGGEFAQEPRGEAVRSGGDSRFLSSLNNPAPPEPSPLPPLQPTLPSLSASTAFPASLTATSSGPSPRNSPSMESAVFAASPAAIAAASDRRGSDFGGSPSMSPLAATGPSAPPVQDALPGVPAPVAYSMAPVKNGVGFLTFAVGLILSAAAAVYFSGRLLKRDFEVAARNFVERSVLDQATASHAKFEAATKTHVTALEADVKALKDQLALMQAANDSLKAAAGKPAEEAKKAEAPVAKKARARRR